MGQLQLTDVTKNFGAHQVIQPTTLTIENGEFVVFVGPSGCGKSTMLRMIAGLEDITSGTLEIDGKVVNALPPVERGISMVFQSYALYPHMNVYENIAFPLRVAKMDDAQIRIRVMRAAETLQLTNRLEHKPGELSGGQRQRVAIGRAIVREPSIFLFDEPLSNLDAALRMDMRLEIGHLHKRLGASMIYVTHDQVEAMTLADKIVVLKGGEVMQVGAPMELYNKPANKFVAGFLGAPSMNFVDVTVESISAGMAKVSGKGVPSVVVSAEHLPSDAAKGARCSLGLRPQALNIVESGGRLHGKVVIAERLGSETVAEIDLEGGGRLIVVEPRDHHLAPGTRVSLDFNEASAFLFPED